MILKIVWLCLTLVEASLLKDVKQKNWDYTLISVKCNSSAPETLSYELKMERIDRGLFAITGSLTLNTLITDEYLVEVSAYRSATGNNNFKLLPFKLPKQTVNYFMENAYTSYIWPSFRNCSNLPEPENNQTPALEKKVYTFTKCKLSTDKMPSYMQTGYYKILYIGTGPIDYVVEVIGVIETKV